MKGIEAHFTSRLGKDAESRTTRTGKPMTVLTVAVSDPDSDAGTWCSVLAFEDLAERLAELAKGAELYAKGRLKAAVWRAQNGDPRIDLTLLATHVEPLTLERKPRGPRRSPVHGGGAPFDNRL